jgi:hypothetical protein
VLDATGKLGKIIVGMNKALGEIPLTVKIRTGVKDGKNTAHKLMPRIATEWQAGCITVCLFREISSTSPSTDLLFSFSSMDALDNNDTRVWLTGTTSNNAWKLSELKKRRKIVRIISTALSQAVCD